jgi:peptidoglycan hydrolase CwlO-like protein
MKKTIFLLLSTAILFIVSCVSPKEFTSYKISQDSKINSIENSINSLNSKLSKLITEVSSLNRTLNRLESQSNQNDNLLDIEVKKLKNRVKSTNDLIATLRIEVALLSKKQ